MYEEEKLVQVGETGLQGASSNFNLKVSLFILQEPRQQEG